MLTILPDQQEEDKNVGFLENNMCKAKQGTQREEHEQRAIEHKPHEEQTTTQEVS